MTNEQSGETWRISENPPDGSNPFRFRLLGGEGRETRPIAMFMHLTDIENVVADHAAAQREATEPIAKHPYKPLPRGDHEITARLCYDCDTWHTSDDSRLYNEASKRDWEVALAAERERADRAEQRVAEFEKAWALPPQGTGQVVTPSAGEVAANAVEEAKIYKEQIATERAAAEAAIGDLIEISAEALGERGNSTHIIMVAHRAIAKLRASHQPAAEAQG